MGKNPPKTTASCFAVLEFPDFELQSVFYLERQPVPPEAVLLRIERGTRERVWQCGPKARERGIAEGMGVAQVMARLPEARLVQRSPSAEECLQRYQTGLGLNCSPRVERTAPGVITIDVSRTRPVSAAAWQKRLWRPSHQVGLRARLGVASTPGLARCAATRADPVKVVGDTRAFLETLPLAGLVPPPMEVRLRDWGVSTVGQWMRLPRAEVWERLGAGAARLWDELAGRRTRVLRIEDPPRLWEADFDFEVPMESLSGFALILRRLLDSLMVGIANRTGAAQALTLDLRLCGGKTHREHYVFPEPVQKEERAWRLIQPRLEGLRLPDAVEGLRLTVTPTTPKRVQTDFWSPGFRDPDRLADTLGRLALLVGEDRMGRVELKPTHAPDAWTLTDFASPPPSVGEDPPPRAWGPGLRRFRPPLPARVDLWRGQPRALRSERFTGTVVEVRGPWKSSGDWWKDERWRRREWDVALEEGTLLLLVGEGEEWRVEGVYQ